MAAIDVDDKLEFVFDEKHSPCSSCHAASILPTAAGTFLVTWFGGSREGEHDVAIWVSHRSTTGVWSTAACAAKVCDAAHWNPVLFRAPGDDSIWLFFKVGNRISHWVTYYVKSTDEGHSWSAPKELVPGKAGVGGRGPVKNKPLVSSLSAHWLAPASDEQGRWSVFLDRSEDGGATWSRTPFLALEQEQLEGKTGSDGGGKKGGHGGNAADASNNNNRGVVPRDTGVIQPSLWESAPGRVHMLMRSDCGFVCRSDSDDDGRTWCLVYKTRLPNNNSGLDVAQLAAPISIPDEREDEEEELPLSNIGSTNGEVGADAGKGRSDVRLTGRGRAGGAVLPLVLCHNPVSSNWGDRYPLRVSFSFDDAASWHPLVEVGKKRGEYSYPSVVALPDGGMAMVFTWRRVRIAFLLLSAEQVREYAVLAGSVAAGGGHVEAYSHPSRSLRHFTHDQFEEEQ